MISQFGFFGNREDRVVLSSSDEGPESESSVLPKIPPMLRLTGSSGMALELDSLGIEI